MQNLASLRYCYSQRILEGPSLRGEIVIQFTINESGEVSQSTINRATTENEDFEKEILEKVLDWKFEPCSSLEPVSSRRNYGQIALFSAAIAATIGFTILLVVAP